MEIILFGVPAAGIIIGLVQLFKHMGMPVGLAPWVAGGLSAAASAIALVLEMYPESAPYLEALVGAVLLWLSLTAVYDKGKDLLKE
jgi:hypothetical protein